MIESLFSETMPRSGNYYRYTDKLPLALMQSFADELKSWLLPVCDRIEIGGSIRRLQPLCKDIELIIIPKNYNDLINRLARWQLNHQAPKVFDKKGPKYIQLSTPSFLPVKGERAGIGGGDSFQIKTDIFLSEPSYFGYTFFLRTGSKEWNKHCMFRLKDLGYTVSDNKIYKIPLALAGGTANSDSQGGASTKCASGQTILCPLTSEADIFNLLQCEPVHPTLRHDRISLAKAILEFKIKHGTRTPLKPNHDS